MKLLVLSFYFPPDLSAGSFRISSIVSALAELGIEIEVISTLPNRYASFTAEAPAVENFGSITVRRVALPPHDSGMMDQARAFSAYYREVKKHTSKIKYDAVFSTSSRLFTAFLGAQIARRKSIPLYLDIRDIFVDTLKDLLPPKLTWVTLPFLKLLERYTFQTAKRINLVSPGFENYFKARYPQIDYRWFTNGIDDEFINVPMLNDDEFKNAGRIRVLYAGNIGEGQGLHTIIPNLARRLSDVADFYIIGAGGKHQELESQCKYLQNVALLPPVKRLDLIDAYVKADVLFLHLNDYEAFKKVLPSKIFEYAALGKPILAGVSGYAEYFLKENVSNCQVFEPSNDEQAADGFHKLEFKTSERSEFVENFARQKIMKEMANDIMDFVRGNDNHV
ncbi:MAG: glycosyltransferase family 4 protein [Idiomarina sp.]